jgi:hypothetical protein
VDYIKVIVSVTECQAELVEAGAYMKRSFFSYQPGFDKLSLTAF